MAPVNSCDKPLALTCGELSGIGPEITNAAWQSSRELDIPPFFLIGNSSIAKARGLKIPVADIEDPAEAAAVFPKALPVLASGHVQDVVAGQPSPENVPLVVSSITQAVEFVLEGRASALVTNPIQKATMAAAGFDFPGHTEFLAHLAGQCGAELKPVMMLANDFLRAIPVTIHIPLADVPGALSSELIVETCRIAYADLRAHFGISDPRLAVSGLNPHAGEGGLLGMEDIEIIEPALAALKEEGIRATGPYPADAMFRDTARDGFDVAICMYHDQALLPVKTLGFHDSVNVTLGLPVIRTSPDHGTALDLAGTDEAKPDSLIAAIRMASEMAVHAAND